MTEKEQALKSNIQQLYKLLEKQPDESKEAYKFSAFLREFLRIESENDLPAIEVMTLIKHHKPIVFNQLRKMAEHNLMLEILTELSMDFQDAKNILEDILKQKG